MALIDQWNAGRQRRPQTLVVQPPRYQRPAPPPPSVGRPTGQSPVPLGTSPLARAASQVVPKEDVAPQEEGSQWGRGLGYLVNNPVTRGILKPLEVLDYPRRAAILGMEQGAALLPEWAEAASAAASLGLLSPMLLVDEDKVAEDERSNWEKLRDPEFGFGQITGDTGNKWLDRTIGFAGDVALDPLTYVAGIGFAGKAGTVGGRAGRAAAVTRAVDQGADAADAAKVLQRGFGYASPEFLEQAGVQGGIRVGLPFTRGRVVPHTEGLVRPLSKARGRAAAAFNDTNTGQRLMNLRTPKGMEDAYRAMFTSQGGDPAVSLERVALEDERLLGQGIFQGEAERLTKQERRELRRAPKSQKARILSEVETEGTDPNALDRALDKVWELAGRFGINTERRLDNYSPHITTRDARKWLATEGEDANDFGALTGITTQKLYEPSGVTMARRLRRGKEVTIKGQKLVIEDDSVEGLNRLFREKYGLSFDVYESDPAIILEKYINMLASDVGWASGFTNRTAKSPGNVITALTDDELRLLGLQQRPPVGPVAPPSVGGPLTGQAGPQQFTLTGRGAMRDDDLETIMGMTGATDVRPGMVGTQLDEEATKAVNQALQPMVDEGIGDARLERTARAGESLIQTDKAVGQVVGSLKDTIAEARRTRALVTRQLDTVMDDIERLSADAATAANAAEQFTWLREYIDYWTQSMDNVLARATDEGMKREVRRLQSEFASLRQRILTRDEQLRNAMPKQWAEDIAHDAYKPSRVMREDLDRARTEATQKVDLAGKEGRLRLAEAKLRDYEGTYVPDPRETRTAVETIRTQRDAAIRKLDDGVEEARAAVEEAAAAKSAFNAEQPKLPRKQADRRAAIAARKKESERLNERVVRAKKKLTEATERRNSERARLESEARAKIDAAKKATTKKHPNANKSHVTRMQREIEAARKEVEDARRTVDQFVGYIEQRFHKDTPWREGRTPIPPELRQLAENFLNEWERAGGFRARDLPHTELAQRMRARIPATQQALKRDGERALERIKVVQEELLGNISDPAIRERLRQRASLPMRQAQEGGRENLANLQRLADRNTSVGPVGIQMPLEQKYIEDVAQANADIAKAQREMIELIGERQGADDVINESNAILKRVFGGGLDETKVKPPGMGGSVAGKGGQQARTFVVEQRTRVEELRQIVDAADLPDDVRLATQKLLNDAVESLDAMESVMLTEAQYIAARDRINHQDLARVLTVTLDDHWTAMKPLLADTADGTNIVIRKELEQQLNQLWTAANHKDFWPLIDTFTNMFKTYATLSPGFHVRNAMSAVFMNSSDNVPVATQMRGANLARRMGRAAKQGKFDEFMNSLDDIERGAIEGAMGTGMGGFFRERGVGDRATARYAITERIFENPLTDASKRAGSIVEASVRIPVVMDTLQRGGTVLEGMQRARRLHFDYSQVSQFDETMKRLIPFWTFMSRNLPLQISQMWTQPRTYAKYNSFIRNFRGEGEENEPDYFGNIGAFRFADVELGGLPMYLQPDFAHTRLEEDAENIEDFVSGENMMRPLTNFNPLFMAPLEFGTKQDFYTGREYDETDLRTMGGPEAPLAFLLDLLGQSQTAPDGTKVYSEAAIDLVRSMVPLYDRSVRLAPGAVTGAAAQDANSRQLESYLRFIGVPVRQLSPEQQRAQARSERFDMRDDRRLQQAIMEAAAG